VLRGGGADTDTPGMSGRNSLALGLLAACGLTLLAAPARADLYRWVDEKGNVHISDTPPASGGNARRIESKEPERGGEDEPRLMGPSPAGVHYRGGGTSRALALEKVVLKLENESAEPRVVSSGCMRPITIYSVQGWGQQLRWESGFYGRLEELGYQTPRSSDTLKFAGEERGAPELSAMAVIHDLHVSGCNQVSRLEVQWRIYDNLHRKVVLETTTIGEDRVDSRDPRHSLLEAFVDSLNDLTGDAEFQALVAGEGRAAEAPASADAVSDEDTPGAARVPRSDLAPIALAVHYGSQVGSFSAKVESLKRGSVTVRTAGGHGSGFVLSSPDYVLTNNHVVRGSKRVIVVFDGAEIEASVLRTDADRDVALLELATSAPAAPLALARVAPREGETLYAMGTPLTEKLAHTVTRGILSAKRKIDGKAFYQTDASINPGNSGGPVFDEHGEVVAIAVSGLFSQDGAGLGVNLLIPIQDALAALEVSAPAAPALPSR